MRGIPIPSHGTAILRTKSEFCKNGCDSYCGWTKSCTTLKPWETILCWCLCWEIESKSRVPERCEMDFVHRITASWCFGFFLSRSLNIHAGRLGGRGVRFQLKHSACTGKDKRQTSHRKLTPRVNPGTGAKSGRHLLETRVSLEARTLNLHKRQLARHFAETHSPRIRRRIGFSWANVSVIGEPCSGPGDGHGWREGRSFLLSSELVFLPCSN